MIDVKVINTIAIGEDRINHAVFRREKGYLKLLNYSYFDFDFNDIDRFKLIAKDLKSFSDRDLFTNITFVARETIKEIFPIKGNPKDVKMDVIEHIKDAYMVELADFYFDYTISSVEDLMVCYAVLFPKKIGEVIFRDLTKEGFKLITAETDCDSYKRGILKLRDENHFLLLHIRRLDSVFMIFKDGVMMLERQVINGFSDLVDGISLQMGITPENAEEHLVNKGLDKMKNGDDEYAIVASVVDRLSMQIQRTLDLYFQTYRGGPPSNIIITGMGVKIPDLDKYISELFALPAFKESFMKLMGTEIDLDFKRLDYLDAMICLGLEE
ncbi:hypothetical protein [Calditerrivibrio sp.]|uniref:hypothetical protein n=1 Tax=Calditerrivibrio sp. TaxID=2792612 RepID=UPI003D1199E2